jgi:hypothetical protein
MSIKTYSRKVVLCGDIIELYEYIRPQIIELGRKKYSDGSKAEKDEYAVLKGRQDNGLRSKQRVRRLVNANCNRVGFRPKMVTLTFKNLIQDFETANHELEKWIKRFKNKFKFDPAYVCVPEFQDRGALHFHLIIFNMPFIPWAKLLKTWGLGSVWISKKYYKKNPGAYLSKYVSKSFTDSRYFGKKRYSCSLGLVQPIEITDQFKIDSIISGSTEDWAKDFESKYTGGCHFSFRRIKTGSPSLI